MAKYKITKTDEYYTYELPAHNECKLTRLHDPADVEGGKLILSRSHFLPAGGGTDFSTMQQSLFTMWQKENCSSKARMVRKPCLRKVTVFILQQILRNA